MSMLRSQSRTPDKVNAGDEIKPRSRRCKLNTFITKDPMLPLPAEKRQATESRVLNEARRLFEQRGFTATTIRDIAHAAGVSVGTVMAAGDKPALLVQVFDDLIAAEHATRSAPPTAGTCVDRILGSWIRS